MATSTILRVKRKIEENPQDALVLLCKRVKTDSGILSPSLFVFQGTVNNQEADSVKYIVPKNDVKVKNESNLSNIIEKLRKEKKDAAQESRYEIVNCSRGLKTESYDKSNFDLVDLQKKSDEEEDVKYAYDLYIAARENDFDVSMLDDLVSIENYETNLIFGSYRDNGLNQASDDDEDGDDDSNDENNWRNDYPDSENSSINEEDMIKAIENCDIGDDLSSDAGEDKIYNDPSDPFSEDVERYGEGYAKYKARLIKEDPELSSRSIIHCSKVGLDEESVDGYKDDDDGFYYGQDEDTEQFREQYHDVSSDEYSPD